MSGKNPLGLGKEPQAYEGVNVIVPVGGWRLVKSVRSPTSNDFKYPIGSIWVDTTTNAAYILTSAPGNWSLFGASSGGSINSITGDSGGAELPSSGNFNLLGTANQITVTGSAATETFSLSSSLVAPGSVTATTSITATAGDITATLGNVIINGAAKQLRVHGGAVTDFIGTATLTSGSSGAIANTNIAATDRIFLQRIAANASTTLGELSYTISASNSFTITSLILGTPASPQTGDASTVGYFIVRQV
jgi:hypothetical protein